jgi:hypothetical protein
MLHDPVFQPAWDASALRRMHRYELNPNATWHFKEDAFTVLRTFDQFRKLVLGQVHVNNYWHRGSL